MKDAFTHGELHPNLLWTASDTIALVTLYAGGPTWESCIRSLLMHTSPDLPICIWDDAGPSEEAIDALHAAELEFGREVFYFRQPQNVGIVRNLNSAFTTFSKQDVIVLNSDIIVGPGWDFELRAAAKARTDIATVTALATEGTLFTVAGLLEASAPAPSAEDFIAVADAVRKASARLTPLVPTATSHCTLFTRRALNVCGLLDEVFSPGYGEEVDFSLRCSSYGFTHVAADAVLVYHVSGESFGEPSSNPIKIRNDKLVSERYPYWQELIEDFLEDDETVMARALALARVSVLGLDIVVDGEVVHPSNTGTFEGATQLLSALVAHAMVRRIVIVVDKSRVEELESGLVNRGLSEVRVMSPADARRERKFDLAFRPCQDYSGEYWPHVRALARRNVIWHLDSIAVRNPSYSKDYRDFRKLVDSTLNSLESANAIGVLTEHVREDLRSWYDGYAFDERVFLLPNGPTGVSSVDSEPHPMRIENWGVPVPFILALGTNYRHKNLTWLIRVVLQMRRMGWQGGLVIAGPTPDTGTSLYEDLELLRKEDDASFAVLGRVSEEQKQLLISAASLVATPSTTEGWGLIPIEAAMRGTVSISSDGGGLRDILPENAYILDLADDQAAAETMLLLLTDEDLGRRQVSLWKAKAKEFTWDDSAAALIENSFLAISRPSVSVSRTRKARPGPRLKTRLKRLLLVASTAILPAGSGVREKIKAWVPSVRF